MSFSSQFGKPWFRSFIVQINTGQKQIYVLLRLEFRSFIACNSANMSIFKWRDRSSLIFCVLGQMSMFLDTCSHRPRLKPRGQTFLQIFDTNHAHDI